MIKILPRRLGKQAKRISLSIFRFKILEVFQRSHPHKLSDDEIRSFRESSQLPILSDKLLAQELNKITGRDDWKYQEDSKEYPLVESKYPHELEEEELNSIRKSFGLL